MDREGYIKISHLPKSIDVLGLNNTLFKYITFKAGQMEIDFGLWHLIRSDNAQVQKNPLIGNYIIDANTVEPAMELISKKGFFNWVIGFGNGTTTGDFQPGRGTEVHGKVWLNFDNKLNIAGSVYRVNQSNNGTGYPSGGTKSYLYAGNRSGSRYAGIFGAGPEVGQIAPAKGQNVTAYQFDGYYNVKPLKIFGMYGYTKDSDINGSAPGSPEEAWSYYGADVTYYLTPALYVAARYNAAISKKYHGKDADINVNRIQLGGGLWITDYVLLKLEYVNQHYKGFSSGPYAYNARFHGFLTEFSVFF
ncbi:MAG TPA: porin [Ignavibacteria bacterium]|nr:porin [Ignavibacteria bacterium]